MTHSEDEIRDLLSAYGRLVDAADYDAVGELFTQGALLAPDGREIARGKEGVAKFYQRTVMLYNGSPGTEHVTQDETIKVDEQSGTATSEASFVTHQQVDGRRVLVARGRYSDRFRREDGRWRFTTRQFFLDESNQLDKHVRSKG